jgi:hypothetical protein
LLATENAVSEPESQRVASNPKFQWIGLTPDRFFIALLLAECLLLLSERLQWFGFNLHKGWTLLIAIACAGVAAILPIFFFAVTLILRRRFQFGVRSLLMLFVVIAVPSSWLEVEVREASERCKAATAIEKLGGLIWYDYQVVDGCDYPLFDRSPPSGSTWLRGLLGDDAFTSIVGVQMLGSSTQATDASLKYLRRFTTLQTLSIQGSYITDMGLENLKELNQLQALGLIDTQITDAGLEHLEGLTKLKELYLAGSRVTPAGVKKLQSALPKCRICCEPPKPTRGSG